MTTLQEAAMRKALELGKKYAKCLMMNQAPFDEALAVLAQQGGQQPVAWYEYNQDLDAWFLAYGHNPKAKTRPLVFGDTAAPAPQAQEPVVTGWDNGLSQDYDKSLGRWFADRPGARQQLVETLAAPQPAQDKSDNYLSGYCTGRTDLLKEQSARLVTQPLAKTCDTCAHYQQGKHPGASIHDETCYECRSYWGNKWEAA